MHRNITSPPRMEPVTLDELKSHARIDVSDDDHLLISLITAARNYCELFTRIAFITQSWLISYDEDDYPFKTSQIAFRHGHIQRIENIMTYDRYDVSTLFPNTHYRVNNHRIALLYGKQWPSNLREFDCVQIAYTVGYGDKAEDVPSPIRQAIKLLAAYWYEAREAVGDMMNAGKETAIPFGIQSLLLPYKQLIV